MENVVAPTYGDLSEIILKRILKDSATTYFVTDQYLPGSIKSFERSRRGSTDSIKIKIQRRD